MPHELVIETIVCMNERAYYAILIFRHFLGHSHKIKAGQMVISFDPSILTILYILYTLQLKSMSWLFITNTLYHIYLNFIHILYTLQLEGAHSSLYVHIGRSKVFSCCFIGAHRSCSLASLALLIRTPSRHGALKSDAILEAPLIPVSDNWGKRKKSSSLDQLLKQLSCHMSSFCHVYMIIFPS